MLMINDKYRKIRRRINNSRSFKQRERIMTETKKTIINEWNDERVDVTSEANFIWSIANKLRGSYMPDHYGDVIIPMTIIRRFECALAGTKEKVVETFEKNPTYPAKAMYRISGYEFYNTSRFDLKELGNDPDHEAANFKAYIAGFSSNVQDILKGLAMDAQIDKMNTDGCLYNVVQAFSDLDLSVENFDSIKMGYIFENLIGRFYQNVDAGQFYTGRDIIRMIVSVLMAEGCDDIFDENKVITICDQACGTGGMLSTAYSYIKQLNPSADIRLFGQEMMGQSYAIGLAEMLIKGQNSDNFRNEDTFKTDCWPDTKMRFLLENPPFGTPWSGADAKAGQEQAVKAEFEKSDWSNGVKNMKGRWGAGLPAGGDSQLLFMQSAIAKMADNGRAAIIENGSPLFTGGVASGESQIRRWILENDLLEAIIAMPTDLFYNTGITTYVWILSKDKRQERRGYVQLIDATNIYHKLRKPLGNKKNEFTKEDRAEITKLYADFKEGEHVQIYPNTEFMYREYTVMQPLQRSYGITEERIQNMIQSGTLSFLYDEAKISELENKPEKLNAKEEKKLAGLKAGKPLYDAILSALNSHISDTLYMSPEAFKPVLTSALEGVTDDKKLLDKIENGLSVMDKNAEIQRDKKGNVLYDKSTADTERVKYDEDIDTYMKREVLPHIPDAKAFFEEDVTKKKPVIKTGAEIPFTRYFYKYQQPEPSEKLAQEFMDLEKSVNERIQKLFGDN